MPRGAVLALLSAAGSLVATACGETSREAVLVLAYEPPSLEPRAVAREVTARRGGCEGEVAFRATLEAAGQQTPPLSAGRWGFEARAGDRDCQWYAAGCAEVDLPADSGSSITVTLAGVPEEPSCSTNEVCREGRCEAVGGVLIPEDMRLAAGRAHTCLKSRPGQLDCWGYNASGQLGDGTRTTRAAPVSVMGWSEDAGVVSTGGEDTWLSHTCAVVGGGRVRCWGYNTFGQLGDGTTSDRVVPGPSIEGLTAIEVSAGGRHTCAVNTSGDVFCWGDNAAGQLGADPAAIPFSTDPVEVADQPPSAFVVLTTGTDHSCALNGGGDLYCWGSNGSGRLGAGTISNSPAAIRIFPGAIEDLADVSAGDEHTCAVGVSGTVYCWGKGTTGQLGDGALEVRRQPVIAVGVDDAVSVVTGSSHSCALLRSGEVRCWGGNSRGQLGNGAQEASPVPVAVVSLSDAIRLEGGWSHTCAIRRTGDVVCWGQNQHGRLGDGTEDFRQEPVPVIGFGG